MKLFNLSFFLILTGFAAFCQDNQKDTFMTRLNSETVTLNDKDFLKSSVGAEKYVRFLLRDSFYKDHIKIDLKQTRKEIFHLYLGESGDARHIENLTYYNIHYYLMDKNDTLSYFNLLVDSLGIPTPHDKHSYFSSQTKLFSFFRMLFQNKLQINFQKAVTIGRQHGFDTKPFLNSETLSKKGIYWSFSQRLADGKRKLMDINAKTGSIKKYYMLIQEE